MPLNKPPKLKTGDEVRIITPVMSLSIHDKRTTNSARKRLEQLGLKVTFGQHVFEQDLMDSSSIEHRIADLHTAFSDPHVKMVMAAEGGFNSNQLLRYLDWNLIKANHKIFIGYSDVTALNNAILTKANLINYSGPLFASLGNRYEIDYTLKHFHQCLFANEPITLTPARRFNNDNWTTKKQRDTGFSNSGFWIIHPGKVEGRIIGGNLSTLALLQGTEYFPDLTNSILFLEDDYEYQLHHFDRNLQSLIHLPDFPKVKALVLGRFETGSHSKRSSIEFMINTKKELTNLPIIANVDFGHTNPKITLPIGGTIKIQATSSPVEITITNH